MKLTEDKLRKIIAEETQKLNEKIDLRVHDISNFFPEPDDYDSKKVIDRAVRWLGGRKIIAVGDDHFDWDKIKTLERKFKVETELPVTGMTEMGGIENTLGRIQIAGQKCNVMRSQPERDGTPKTYFFPKERQGAITLFFNSDLKEESNSTKITESRLKQIISDEVQKLNEVTDDTLRGKTIERLVMTFQDALTIEFQDGTSADINIDPRGGFSIEKN